MTQQGMQDREGKCNQATCSKIDGAVCAAEQSTWSLVFHKVELRQEGHTKTGFEAARAMLGLLRRALPSALLTAAPQRKSFTEACFDAATGALTSSESQISSLPMSSSSRLRPACTWTLRSLCCIPCRFLFKLVLALAAGCLSAGLCTWAAQLMG